MRRRSHKSGPSLGLGFVFGLGALVAGAWLIGLVWFAATMPDWVEDDSTATDAIVVWTGGSERLETGFRLLADNKAEKLFVSGVYHGVEVAELLALASSSPDELKCCVTLGYSADNTIGNAAETARWMAAQKLRSLRLVTSNYHMRRSLLELRAAMPDAMVVPHPVFPDAVKQDDWWRWPGTAHLIANEYTKFLLAELRHRIGLGGSTMGESR